MGLYDRIHKLIIPNKKMSRNIYLPFSNPPEKEPNEA